MKFVLATAAYNEEKFIEKTMRSVVAQSLRPVKWVIVSDGSTDRTDEMVQSYAAQHEFISLHRITEKHARNFGAQVRAINTGYEKLKGLDFDFFGNVDADVALPPNYYASLAQKFDADAKLGLAGGFIHEDSGQGFRSRSTNNTQSVAHAIQLFRRQCFEEIGGYIALPYGGPDWVAELMARRLEWRVEAFPDLPVEHYRPSASAGGFIRGCYRQGRMDHSLGSLWLFEIVKCLRRIKERPILLGATARLLGFGYSHLIGAPRLIPPETVEYLRAEQGERLRTLFRIPSAAARGGGSQ